MSDHAPILPQIDGERCTGCGQCVAACPGGALALTAGRADLAQPEACAYCADCEDLCPAGAIGLPYVVEAETRKTSETQSKSRRS